MRSNRNRTEAGEAERERKRENRITTHVFMFLLPVGGASLAKRMNEKNGTPAQRRENMFLFH